MITHNHRQLNLQQTRLSDQVNWEIYLEEENKGSIALSSSGSGLKTVILVLSNLILVPAVLGAEPSDCIFGFEELENNLHPGLQRRLLQFMEDYAAEGGATFFLTTHSNIAIDRFSSSDQAQLIHVTHEDGESRTQAIGDAVSHGGVLDDLDVRASDLLQANAVVWVEGPSDRIYVNALLERLYGGQLREGAHYQCVFYGGRLLAHMAADSSEVDELVNMLNVNRHCVVVMDRDTYQPNQTKRRIREQVETVGGITWTTKRKEIECDMPTSAISSLFDVSAEVPESLQPFEEYLDTLSPDKDEGRRYLRDKVGFAQRLSEHLTAEAVRSEPDLRDPILRIAAKLATWNQITLQELDSSADVPPTADDES